MSVQGAGTPGEAMCQDCGKPVIEIPLTRSYVTRIHAEDKVLTSGRRWTAAVEPHRRTVYAVAVSGGNATYLHRLLAPGWTGVDHADGDGLNNCRCNLRDGGGFRNNANKRLGRNNTSGYKGVGWSKRKGKWRAGITINRKSVFLGYFSTAKEAADAYDQAAISHFGEYAMTNAMLSQVPASETGTWQHNPATEQTHCRRGGHEYTPENTYINPQGRRVCRKCTRERRSDARKRKRAQSPKRPPGRFCPPDCTCGRHRSRK